MNSGPAMERPCLHSHMTPISKCFFCGSRAFRRMASASEELFVLRVWEKLDLMYVSCCPRCQRHYLPRRAAHCIKFKEGEFE